MPGQQERDGSLIFCVSVEERIPPQHLLKRIGTPANYVLPQLRGDFEMLQAREGRPSVSPADSSTPTTANRLLNDVLKGAFLDNLMGSPEVKPLLSDECFSVDETLLQAWASQAFLERIARKDGPSPKESGTGERYSLSKGGKKRAKGD